MEKQKQTFERVAHGFFLAVTVGGVLLMTVYLIVSGLPAIREIGLVDFLFGDTWAATAAEPRFGILPFLLTSGWGRADRCTRGLFRRRLPGKTPFSPFGTRGSASRRNIKNGSLSGSSAWTKAAPNKAAAPALVLPSSSTPPGSTGAISG